MRAEDILDSAWAKLIGIAIIIALPTAVWVFSSAQEAAAFERVTGKHVSTWDAMWIELRVQEGPAK